MIRRVRGCDGSGGGEEHGGSDGGGGGDSGGADGCVPPRAPPSPGQPLSTTREEAIQPIPWAMARPECGAHTISRGGHAETTSPTARLCVA